MLEELQRSKITQVDHDALALPLPSFKRIAKYHSFLEHRHPQISQYESAYTSCPSINYTLNIH